MLAKRIVSHVALMLAFIMIACQTKTDTPAFPTGKLIDLTYSFSDKTIYWPTAKTFALEKVTEGMTPLGFYYAANNFCAAEHGGTHIDSPIHFAAGQRTTDEIPLEQLIGPAIVVDVSANASQNRDYQVLVDDFEAWESQHGQISDSSIVLLRTGFGKFWPDREQYMGTSELGDSAVAKLHFPGLHPEAAAWLVNNHTIDAIGLDTPSIDYGQSTHYESHQTLFKANIPAFENVANLELLPVTGATVIALPMKIEGGS